MAKIVSRSIGATLGDLGDIHQIATYVLHVIREGYHIHSIHKLSTSSVHL